MIDNQEVILLDESWQPCGTMLKSDVHSTHTPLHHAFSCYLFASDGKVLVTKRSLKKIAWPGVWTNAFCGHPMPEELLTEAVIRRADYELGAQIDRLRLQSKSFSYQATDTSGIMENEVCPVYSAHICGELHCNADELSEYEWVELNDLIDAVKLTPFAFSPWMVAQLSDSKISSGLKRYRNVIINLFLKASA